VIEPPLPMEAFFAQEVRLSPAPGPSAADPVILAVALAFAGSRAGSPTRIDRACHHLMSAFPGREFYAAGACDCGLPNCQRRPYGTIGYLEGHVDDLGIAVGANHVLLRFDRIEGGGP
jgi:hypothetical protein